MGLILVPAHGTSEALSRPRTLVTGAGGFVGRWLLPSLRKTGGEVIGLFGPADRPDEPDPVVLDLREERKVWDLLREVTPDRIVHLAAIAFPPEADENPQEALRVNYGVVHTLLEGMARFVPHARLLYVGTAAAYGAGPLDRPPFEEKDPLRPDSLYASTKAAAEQRCVLAVEQEGLDVVRVRPFNHTGPGRPPTYVESSLARQLVRIERDLEPPILQVGNLEMVRDFCDVRDVVSAYELLLDRAESGSVYNVCSGQGCSIRELLEGLLAQSSVQPRIERDPSRYRPAPPNRLSLVGSSTKIRALGWSPRLSLEATLGSLLDHWRSET